MSAAVPPLTAPEVARIAAIAGRLASNHDGEALNAARMLCRSIGKHGLRPEELVVSALAPKPIGYSINGGSHGRAASAGPSPVHAPREHQRQAAECLRAGSWTLKEDGFLRDMLLWARKPSPAQSEWLGALVAKARAARGGAA